VLGVYGKSADPRVQTGASPLERPLSSGTQSYDTKKQEWPLTEPLLKLEGKVQVRVMVAGIILSAHLQA